MKSKYIIFFVLSLIASFICLGCYFAKQGNQINTKHKWTQPFKTTIVKKVAVTGTIKPRQEVGIKAQVSGVIEELYVEPGMIVKKGQKIAKIKLVPSQVNINTANSAVKLAQLQLKEAKMNLAQQKTILTNQLDLRNFKTSFENARREDERYAALLEKGVVSEQEYNKISLDRELKLVAYENAKLNSKNNIEQFEVIVAIKEQELKSAINNLQLLKEGIAMQSNQVANIITATIDGTILDITVKVGSSVIERNTFNEGTTIVAIADMNNLIFEGNIDEADVGKLKNGMPLNLTVGAIELEKITAVLEYIAPKGVEIDGSVKFEVKAAIHKKEDTVLRAGYSATANIILNNRSNVLAIKERDLLFEDDLAFVEVKLSNQQFEKIPVEIGLSDGVNIEILNELNTNSLVKIQ